MSLITISGSKTTDSSQNPVSNATISFVPKSSFRAPGPNGGQVTVQPVTAQIIDGAFTIQVYDVELCEPQRVPYIVTIVDNVTGNVILGGDDGYLCQPSATGAYASYWVNSNSQGNWDLFNPTYPVYPILFTGTVITSGVGPMGPQGNPGTPATIAVGPTTALPAGAAPTVTNEGSASAAVLAFAIPAGAPGTPGINGTNGAPGTAATVAVGNVTALAPGSTPTVSNTGNSAAAVLNFGIPQGLAGTNGTNGQPGAAATVTVGTVTAGVPGQPGSVTNVGTANAAVLNIVLPVVSISIGETVTLPAGSAATSSFSPGSDALHLILNFGLPTGAGSGTGSGSGTGTSTGTGTSGGTLTLTDSNGTNYLVFANGNQPAETPLAGQSGAATPVASIVLIDYDDSGNTTGSYTIVASANAQLTYTATSNGTGAVASFTIPDPTMGGTRTVISRHNAPVYS